MLLEIEHKLRFEYDDFVRESFMEVRVEPVTDRHQTLRSFYLAVGPPTHVSRYSDWNGNAVHHFGVSDYHARIEILTRSAVDTKAYGRTLSELRGEERPVEAKELGGLRDFLKFGALIERSPSLERLDAELGVDSHAPIAEQIEGIGHRLAETFEYQPGVTDFRTTTDAFLNDGRGVCQDFAHSMLGLLRLRGIACRYVSGYLHVESTDAVPSQSHAWIEALIPGHGWVPFDPTHDQMPDERYVVVGRGRDYNDVPPNRGIFQGDAEEQLTAAVITRVAPPKDVASLQAEIGQLDVPVYQEPPRLPFSSDEGNRDAAQLPDQQQQPQPQLPRQQQQQQQQH